MTDPTNLIVLDPKSGEPVYRQLVNQVLQAIAKGHLVAGETLPSVRKLAKTLTVNPMTVSKAYGLLETSGAVVRRHGIGMIVAEVKVSTEDVLKPQVEKIVASARSLDLRRDELLKLVRQLWEEK